MRRNGELWQFVELRRPRLACRRIVAGAAATNCNDDSIGIELEGLEGEPFEAGAVRNAGRACAPALAQRYPIALIAGHEHIAPGRKDDPGSGFDWRLLQRSSWAGTARCFPPAVATR